MLESQYEEHGAITFEDEEEHCLRPSLLRTGVVTRAEQYFISCLDEVCDRRIRRHAEFVYRMRRLDEVRTMQEFDAVSGPISKRPPIRVRFGSNVAFYYSYESAKGNGKGKDDGLRGFC